MSVDHWEAYYRGGALASCPLGGAPGYTLEVRDGWLAFFGALPDGARVVDLGTGNGALLLIAADAAAAAGRRLELHGTDLAGIDPVRHVPGGERLFAGMQFHPRTAAEALPFDPGTVDAVSGQYALEYTDVARALSEAARVLRPGAPARFVVHHADSVVVASARGALEDAHYVLNEEKVLRKLRRYLEAERGSPSSLRPAWQALVQSGTRLQQRGRERSGSPVLGMVNDVLRRLFDQRQGMTVAQLEAAMAAIDRELRTHVRRLNDLVAAARSEEGMAGICDLARQAGFEAPALAVQQHDGRQVVGWQLAMTRR